MATFQFDWDDDPDQPRPGPRQWRRLYVLTAVGGILAIMLAIAGIVLVRHEIDKPDHRREAVIAKYQKQLDDCVHRGDSVKACSDRVLLACMDNSYWGSNQIELSARSCNLRITKQAR